MINLLSSQATYRNDDFKSVERVAGEDNLAWIRKNIPREYNQITLVMVGGNSPTSFRLRLAQSHVRSDLMPSYWSHVFLLDKLNEDFRSTQVYEISVEPQAGFGFPVPTNGVQVSMVGLYADPVVYPNVAVLQVPVELDQVLVSLEAFKRQRAVLDGIDLIVHWLAYIWGVARSPNPLLEGMGIPSAAMLEVVIGTCGFALTPGLESRSSCPEAIWQAAIWWHEYYKKQGKPAISGGFFCPHQIQ